MLVAVDTGGTKTLVASFGEDGRIDDQFKFATPKDPIDYAETLITHLEAHFGTETVDAIVVAIPGIVKEGVAVWCNNLKWKNFNVAAALKGVLGGAPLFIENDANLAGLAEARQLPIIPELALYITVSTGIGSGIITNGVINHALRFSEIGRTQVEYKGSVREWETFASGKAVKRIYGKYAADLVSKRAWNQIADRISRGLLATIPVLQPSVIIIGGSIGTYFDKFGTRLKEIVADRLPAHIPTPHIVKARHPETAVIYGCYYYALDALAAA